MRNCLKKRFPVLLIIVLCAVPAFVQDTTGTLTGTVTHQNGAVVAGANVTVNNTATNQGFSTQTNNDGGFNVPTLSTGIYTVTISATDFKEAVVAGIKVNVGENSDVSVALKPGAVNETVTVTADCAQLPHTSVNGLPTVALNITLDGINGEDNLFQSRNRFGRRG